MLNYRRQEREQKSASKEARQSSSSCPSKHPFPEAKKDGYEVIRQYVTHDRMNSVLPTITTDLLPKEITAVEPFNAFPSKVEPYILKLLSSCECLTRFRPFFSMPSVFLAK